MIKDKQMTLLLPRDPHRKVRRHAARSERSASAVVRLALASFFNEKSKVK